MSYELPHHEAIEFLELDTTERAYQAALHGMQLDGAPRSRRPDGLRVSRLRDFHDGMKSRTRGR